MPFHGVLGEENSLTLFNLVTKCENPINLTTVLNECLSSENATPWFFLASGVGCSHLLSWFY